MASIPQRAKQGFPQDDARWKGVTDQILDRLGSEDVSDVLIGSAYLARRRAQLLHRPVQLEDLEFTLSVFCFWPLKPDPPAQVRADLTEVRRPAFEGASRAPEEKLRQTFDELVPDSTLVLDPAGLHEKQRDSVEAFLSRKPHSQPHASQSSGA